MCATAIRIVQEPDGRRRLVHDWPREAAACRALQAQLAAHLEIRDDFGPVHTLCGIDIGFEEGGRTTRAAAVVLDARDLVEIEQALIRMPTRMPYIPGLLSFRETPGALAALEALSTRPDLLMVDGHGMAHPRRLGVATHLGLLSGLPSLGVAKKRLTGRHPEVPDTQGTWVALTDGDETIGAVLRSRTAVKPIFISPGHRMSLDSAIAWTARALTRYRLPEPIRAADRLASNR